MVVQWSDAQMATWWSKAITSSTADTIPVYEKHLALTGSKANLMSIKPERIQHMWYQERREGQINTGLKMIPSIYVTT